MICTHEEIRADRMPLIELPQPLAPTLAAERPSAGIRVRVEGAEVVSGASEGFGNWNWTPTTDGGSYSGPHGPDICPAIGCQHEGGAA